MKHFLLASTALLFFAACESRNDYEVSSQKKYENSKATLQETEQQRPSAFLTIAGENKKNLLGQTVIRAEITNNAKVVHYKDVEVKLSFFSKTGQLLEEDKETVYENIAPGTSKKFKSKYFTPKGTDSVSYKIITAKY